MVYARDEGEGAKMCCSWRFPALLRPAFAGGRIKLCGACECFLLQPTDVQITVLSLLPSGAATTMGWTVQTSVAE